MRHLFLCCLVILLTSACHQQENSVQPIADSYLDAWVDFYPSMALSAGATEAAPRFEDLAQDRVDTWLAVNQRTLALIRDLRFSPSLDERIDRQLLERQIMRDLYRWGDLQAQLRDPLTYAGFINHALTPVLVRENLSAEMKLDAIVKRMQGLQQLCITARDSLVDGCPTATESAIRDIRSTAAFLEDNLGTALEMVPDTPEMALVVATAAETAEVLESLASWMEDELATSLGDSYGEERYARELALAYGEEMTPGVLEQISLDEIQTVRSLMDQLARIYWEDTRENEPPSDFDQLIRPVLAEMEQHRSSDQQEFLQEFLVLIDRSERFLEDNDLADLPEYRTLFTDLSPSHFAGAAVGGVYSAGPFDPEAETLFYLPSVPDSAPEQARDGFYRSFNNHFNSMIITHEIYPGHYMQLKAAAYHPSRIRPLFAGDDFTEGWASFCEQMMLDTGWDDDQPLTRLAHLRKRLENAVRAYVSVQVHCRGWGEDELHTFAVETGLLPPQFAENLWLRALFTPIQLPSYFVGFRVFDDVYENERARRGAHFRTRDFNNAVIASGGIPLAMLEDYLSDR